MLDEHIHCNRGAIIILGTVSSQVRRQRSMQSTSWIISCCNPRQLQAEVVQHHQSNTGLGTGLSPIDMRGS